MAKRGHLWLGLCLVVLSSCAPASRPEPALAEIRPGHPGSADDYVFLAALHREKGVPAPGSWNAKFKEQHQSFSDYITSRPRRKIAARQVIYLQPIGNFTERELKTIGVIAEFISLYYNSPVRQQSPKPLALLPVRARQPDPISGTMYLHVGTTLNKLLLADLPKDALFRLGVTTADLEVPEGHQLNSIYGMAYLRFRVALCSLSRLHPDFDDEAEYLRFLRRALKIAAHESGHALGIPHCSRWECNMNGTLSLLDVDQKPLWLCPDCLRKLCWACGTDPVERLRHLAGFCKKYKLAREATFYYKCARELAGYRQRSGSDRQRLRRAR